jgi:hypothetical protein
VHKTPLTATPLSKLRRRSHARETAPHVHFHQGPQGKPMPCYDNQCTSPKLSL